MNNETMASKQSSSVYNDLRLEGKLMDAVIRVEDVEFNIHKIILCNCSPYFRALFTRCSDPERKVFNIPGLSPHTMQLIIQFAYTGSVSVTDRNIRDLLIAADMLNVMEVVDMCCNYLGERLSPENCIGIWQFTDIYFLPELQHKAYTYISDNFEEVMSCEEFLQLSVQELSDILDRDDLNVRKESTVYDAVLRWITHIPEKREEHMSVLLSKVRLTLTSEQYIRNKVMSYVLVKDNSDCLQIASNAIAIISHFLRHSPSLGGVCNQLIRHRLPKVIMLAIGGWRDNNPINSIEAYDIRANCWINVENGLVHPRAHHGVVFLNGHVYCVGGYDGAVYYNNLDRFDLSTRTWHELTPMHRRRCYVSVTVLNGCIYAMGGKDRNVRLNSAECYRPEINQWSRIAPMNEPRSDAGCATLHNKVYICGGFDGINYLQTAECYDPETDQWTVIAPMSVRRTGVGVIAYADCIFAVGGFDGHTRLHSAEAYNPQTNTWHTVSSMLTPRSNFGLEVVEDRLFVVGGFNGNTTINKVEFYDAALDKWSEACDMERNRSALRCCVVSGLSNLTNYIVPRDTVPPLPWEDESEASS